MGFASPSPAVKAATKKFPNWKTGGTFTSVHPIARVLAHGIHPDRLAQMDQQGYEVFYHDPFEGGY